MTSSTNQYYNPVSYRSTHDTQVNRPDSSKLVDLHVYILPRNFWKTKQNLAYNETILESISAGFIRVTRDLLLKDLRNEIKKQCSSDEIPRDFVYLKSVGRALTRVKPNQENELKVKYFLPPTTVGPEIFLLEIDQEIANNLLDKFDLKPDSSEYNFHARPEPFNLATSRMDTDRNSRYDHIQLPIITNQKTPRDVRENPFNSGSELNFNNQTNRGKDSASKLSNYDKTKEYDKMKEEQERLRNRQIYLEQMRKKQLEMLKNKQPEQVKKKNSLYDDNSYPSDDEYLVPHRNQNDENEMKQKSALIIQSAYRGFKDREKIRKLQREKALSMIQDTSETGSENNDVDIFQIENSAESLREKLKKTKQRRIELENLRSDLLKHLKTVHGRITVRRKEARDLWKKKYFQEKKKAPELEERTNYLLNEIENLNQKMFASLESDNNFNSNVNSYRNSTINLKNQEQKTGWLESLKLQEEIFMLKRQVDQAKLKLATDIKLRNQAETETKALKSELLQTKMNLLQFKNNN